MKQLCLLFLLLAGCEPWTARPQVSDLAKEYFKLREPLPTLFRPEGASQALYVVRCGGCGTAWKCNTLKPLDSCPSCQDFSNLCPQTGNLILVLAGNMECARHDPDNPIYQQEIARAMALLEQHFSECDRCRTVFSEVSK